MFATIVLKELKSILVSPKFPVTFAASSVLVLLSVFMGIREYRASLDQYQAAGALVQQEMRESRGWMALSNRVYREPDPMQIFASGVHNDVGRLSGISTWEPVKLSASAYSDDPIFALFRFIDFTFIVQVVLTLFAILFTYDSINGERESGTLQLMLSNAVPRAKVITAKFAGAWLGLVVPISVPVLLGISLLLVYKVPMTLEHWVRLGFLIGASVLLFTFFIAFGILVSSVTRRSNISFLVCLVSWVALALIVPRAGMMMAGQVVKVPTDAEIDSQRDSFSKDRWNAHFKGLEEKWRKRNEPLRALPEKEREAKREEMEWTWAEEDKKDRDSMQAAIDGNGRMLREELRNRKGERERLAFALSRFSPVASFQLAAMSLAGTDISLKPRYEDALEAYRTTFNKYKDEKQRESGSSGGIRIQIDTDRGIKIDVGREIALDLTGMPEFTANRPSLSESVSATVVDFGLMGLFSILSFAGAFAMFLRYDPRYAN
ncbi:MAG TPA: ABC transporter permease subunit [Bacteroidota bacterium]|nr:ABC transporter permease subunit [Bacteroidota bacterium]